MPGAEAPRLTRDKSSGLRTVESGSRVASHPGQPWKGVVVLAQGLNPGS